MSNTPVIAAQNLSDNELVLFCEWLSHLYFSEKDIGSGVTHGAILRYVYEASRRALDDSGDDIDEYKRWVRIRQAITRDWDYKRLIHGDNSGE